MFGTLPDHLSQLNSISSPPTTGINAESEEAFWEFMHTDQLFDNFAVQPVDGSLSPTKAERKSWIANQQDESPVAAAAAPAAVVAAAAPTAAQTLESFLATFANEPPAAAAANYRMAVPLPMPYNAVASSSASTPAPHIIDTSAIQPFQNVLPYTAASTPSDDRPSGAKKLKSMGAGPVEIEEDKRKRNTEASARFRAKKKEREQALEYRAKTLEAQVAQLVAEKSSLENENRLLKAIVLGGQGAPSGEAVSSAMAQLGDKRTRE